MKFVPMVCLWEGGFCSRKSIGVVKSVSLKSEGIGNPMEVHLRWKVWDSLGETSGAKIPAIIL